MRSILAASYTAAVKTPAPLFKHVSKTRTGKPSINLQTLIDRFHKKAEVSDDDAIEAARLLSKKRTPLRHFESGSISGVVSPAIHALGRGTQALIDTKHGRLGAARKALTETTKGEIAKNLVTGTLLGAGISSARENLQEQRAKDTYRNFVTQHKDPHTKAAEALLHLTAKLAMKLVAPRTPISTLSANKARKVEQFSGIASHNSMKPPGPSLSQSTVNPRRSISQAFNAFRS